MPAKRGPCLICLCSVYSFPHRLSGGKCTGRTWALYYFTYIRDHCEYCKCRYENNCDVVDGSEDIQSCEGYQMMLHYNDQSQYPQDKYNG